MLTFILSVLLSSPASAGLPLNQFPEPGVYVNADGGPLLPLLQNAREKIDIEIYTMSDLKVRSLLRAASCERSARNSSPFTLYFRAPVPVVESHAMEQICCVVLAAGIGKRMGGNLPKAITKTREKALIDHVLDSLSLLKPTKTVIVVGHGREALESHVRASAGVANARNGAD